MGDARPDFAAWLRGETSEIHLVTPAQIAAHTGLARENLQAIEDEFQIGLRQFTPADFRIPEPH